jgi:hypothetical protein
VINPWTSGRVPGVRMIPTLGAWQNRRKMASAGWTLPQWVRLSLKGGHIYWYAFPALVLSAGQTQLARVTIQEDFWLCAVLADSTSALVSPAGTFRAQLYEDQNSYKYSKYGLDQVNFACLAIEPGLQKVPHFIANGSPVNLKVQNLDGQNPNTVSVALWGYSGWWRQ